MPTDLAKQKIAQLSKLLPSELLDSVYFTPDGCYVWMDFYHPVSQEVDLYIKRLVEANQGCIAKDSVTGRLMYQFPIEHPTCHPNGTPITNPDPSTNPTPTTTNHSSKTKPQVNLPTPTGGPTTGLPLRPPTSDMSPLGQFSLRYCYSCVNPSAGEKPCKADWQQCSTYIHLKIEQEKLDTLNHLTNTLKDLLNAVTTNTQTTTTLLDFANHIRTDTQKFWEHLVGLQDPQALAKIRGNPTPPPTNSPTKPTQTTPQQTLTQTPQTPTTPQPKSSSLQHKPLSPEDIEKYQKIQQNETRWFIDGNITFVHSVTLTSGKPCEKAYLHKNLDKHGQPTPQYTAMPTSGGSNGYFYYASDTQNSEPYKARIKSEKRNP